MSAAPALVAVGSRADLEARVAAILTRIEEAPHDEARARRTTAAVATLTDLILAGADDEAAAWTAYRAGHHATPSTQAPHALRAAFTAWRHGTTTTTGQEAAVTPDVTALVIPADPQQPIRTVTVTWDPAVADDTTNLSDADVFIGDALRHIDHQHRWQLDSERGPLGTRVWWVPQYFWAPGERPVNARAEWFLGATGIDTVRSDLIVTGSADDDAWPASVPAEISALVHAAHGGAA